MNILLGSVQVLHQHVWWGLGVLSQNADTADALEVVGGGGLSLNCDMLTLLKKLQPANILRLYIFCVNKHLIYVTFKF